MGSRRIARYASKAITQSSHSQEGFTLVELMVTVAAFVLLTSVALPRFLAARDAVLISTMVNQGITLAKTCAIINSTGIGSSLPPEQSILCGVG